MRVKCRTAGASVADLGSVSEFVIVTLNGKRVVGQCKLTL